MDNLQSSSNTTVFTLREPVSITAEAPSTEKTLKTNPSLDNPTIATSLITVTIPVSPPSIPSHSKDIFRLSWFSCLAIFFQISFIILFGLVTEHNNNAFDEEQEHNGYLYSMFQDTHIMMVIGFGYLYTLLRRGSWSGVGVNFFITVLVLQWSILCLGFWRSVYATHQANGANKFVAVHLDLRALVDGDYIVATVLISFGAVLGRVSPTQMLIMAILETLGATANVVIGLNALQITDAGGSQVIHTFGAAFGLAFAYMLGDKPSKLPGGLDKLGTSRTNALFAMIGTLFLWAFWPSFNAALLSGSAVSRAVVNTVLSICASTVTSFAISRAVHHGKFFDMEHIQNATLAGGVAIGASCDLIHNTYGALLVGAIAGVVSSYGFSYVSPSLTKLGLFDICGIANLHLMPGLIGGFTSAIAVAVQNLDYSSIHRSSSTQAGYQAVHTIISCVFGIVWGLVVGKVITYSFVEPQTDTFYEDGKFWNVPFDDEEIPEIQQDILGHNDIETRQNRVLISIIQALQENGIKVKVPEKTVNVSVKEQSLSGRSGGRGDNNGTISANLRFLEGSVHRGKAVMDILMINNVVNSSTSSNNTMSNKGE